LADADHPTPVARMMRRKRASCFTMPYRLVWEHRGVYRQYLGDVTIAERRRSFEQITSDRRFDDLRYSITDYLSVGDYEITPEATAEIAALHTGPFRTNPSIVMAAVVERPEIVSAIEDFIQHRFTTVPYRMFRSLADARTWTTHMRGDGANWLG
jgi:hypothetical protein